MTDRMIAVISPGTTLDAVVAMLRGLREDYPPGTLFLETRAVGLVVIERATTTDEAD